MVRVLRYPYLTGAACLCAISCAVARDLCVGKGLLGWSRVLLVCTFVLLGLCFALLSCRFFADELGVGVGFLFGLAMDVQQGSLLGQHALAYTALGFMAVSVHRRLLWFDMMTQAVQILPVLMVANVLQLIVRMIAGGMFPGWSLFIGPLAEGLLWPVVSMLLLAPQRRAPNPDDNRPL